MDRRIIVPVAGMATGVLIVAMTAGQLNVIPLLITLAIIAGAVYGARYLLGYRHELRMREIEAERDLAVLEREQLDRANKILDLDDRTEALRRDFREGTPKEPQAEPPQTS